MKNICFFGCDFQVGGANVVAVNLANEFAKEHNVFLLAASDTDKTSYGRDNISPDIKYYNLGIEPMRILKMRKAVIPKIKEFVKAHDIDIVFGIGYYASFYIAPVLWNNRKCKFVYCEHGAPANQITDRKGTFMRMINVKAHDMTVALTKRSEHDFVRLIKANPKKVCTIYNWIDEATIAEDARYALGCKKILTVGRISEEKGFDMLADIARLVFSRHPDWEWHIMGDGPDREKFEEKIKKYAIEKNIVMHGMVDNAQASFGEYSLMALTSYREGLPLILLEAKAKKLPCVSFDVVTGPAEIVRDGVNGYLIPPYDCEMFACKLCELIENDSLRQGFSDNALLDVDSFKKQKILSEWLELIKSLTK